MEWAKEIVSQNVFENNIVDTKSSNKYIAQKNTLCYEIETLKGTETVEVTFGFMKNQDQDAIPIIKCTVKDTKQVYPRMEMVIPQEVILLMLESGFQKIEEKK